MNRLPPIKGCADPIASLCHTAGWVGALLITGALAACGGNDIDAPPPPPITAIPNEAVGHYCGMFLAEHKGPKGQVLLRDRDTPVWFTTIREVFAYTHLPEEPKAIAATYVQDMTRMNEDGSFPAEAWLHAKNAWYLIRSRYIGGMGTRDALPFSAEDTAHAYQRRYGGQVVRFDDVPQNYIFGLAEPLDGLNLPQAGVPANEMPAPAPSDGATQ